jgi:hypothetical protein
LRYIVAVTAAIVMLSGCSSLMTASGSAAKRWAALDEARAAKANAATGSGKICKDVKVMGSNFPQKVCSTQEEWDVFDKQTRESVDVYDQQRKQGNTQGAFENQ